MALSKLVIIAPDGARRTYQLTRYPIIVGTDQACDITVVASDKVGPRHVRIEESLLTGMPLVVDLGVGPTMFENNKIDRHEVQDRDRIQIADIELYFILPRVKSPVNTPISLEILSGKREGETFPLRGPITIGRKPDNTLQIPQKDVSGQHAKFDFVDGLPIIEDMNSRNGTCVNGEQLQPGERRVLDHGDLVDLASVGILICAEGYALQPAPAMDAMSDSDTSLPNVMNAPMPVERESVRPHASPLQPASASDYDNMPSVFPTLPPLQPASASDYDAPMDDFPPLPPLAPSSVPPPPTTDDEDEDDFPPLPPLPPPR